MKARIIVEYDIKDYELVNCLLGALQSVAINYDKLRLPRRELQNSERRTAMEEDIRSSIDFLYGEPTVVDDADLS